MGARAPDSCHLARAPPRAGAAVDDQPRLAAKRGASFSRYASCNETLAKGSERGGRPTLLAPPSQLEVELRRSSRPSAS